MKLIFLSFSAHIKTFAFINEFTWNKHCSESVTPLLDLCGIGARRLEKYTYLRFKYKYAHGKAFKMKIMFLSFLRRIKILRLLTILCEINIVLRWILRISGSTTNEKCNFYTTTNIFSFTLNFVLKEFSYIDPVSAVLLT